MRPGYSTRRISESRAPTVESGKWKGNEGFVAGLLAMLHSVRDNNHFRKRFQDAIVSLSLSFQV